MKRLSSNDDNDRNGVVPNCSGVARIGVIQNESVGLIRMSDHSSVALRQHIAEATHWWREKGEVRVIIGTVVLVRHVVVSDDGKGRRVSTQNIGARQTAKIEGSTFESIFLRQYLNFGRIESRGVSAYK